LLEEARLLGEVQQALGAGQVTRALAGLREYDAKFPRGGLRVEAEAARVLASCQSGSSEAGRAAAERFSKRYPGSPAVSRVRRACSEPVR
jgi:outer membrane protein assembly factor BamD (BamD/ComL family)